MSRSPATGNMRVDPSKAGIELVHVADDGSRERAETINSKVARRAVGVHQVVVIQVLRTAAVGGKDGYRGSQLIGKRTIAEGQIGHVVVGALVNPAVNETAILGAARAVRDVRHNKDPDASLLPIFVLKVHSVDSPTTHTAETCIWLRLRNGDIADRAGDCADMVLAADDQDELVD